MRLWSIHPRYLDAKGLIALWREGLLARSVFLGKARGYVNHPQLQRFKALPDPLDAVDAYLSAVFDEAQRRGYRFDKSKIRYLPCTAKMPVQRGQIELEWGHLLKKLRQRAPERLKTLRNVREPAPHPCFETVPGSIESWERP